MRVVLGGLDQEFYAAELREALTGNYKHIQVTHLDGHKFGCVPPEWGPCPIYALVFTDDFLGDRELTEVAEEALNRAIAEVS